MRSRLVLFFGFCALILLSSFFEAATAAEITVLKMPGQPFTFIMLKGEIVAGDAGKFDTIAANTDRASVVLESPGGLMSEALQIGAQIKQSGYATMVLPLAECYSACGLVWISGAHRYMSQSSIIGFHAAYKNENGQNLESGVANAEIGSFLTHMGLRIEAIRFLTTAAPNEISRLTLDRARSLGIEVYEQDGLKTTTPQEKPTVDIYAEAFVSYSFLQSACARYIKPDLLTLEKAQRAVFDKGNELVDYEQWAQLMTTRLDLVIQQAKSNGFLLHCIEVEKTLRSSGLNTGISGPSFDCAGSLLPTEATICTTEDFWAKDRAISEIYNYLRRGDDRKMQKKLSTFQRKWLALRDSCGSNPVCLGRIYDARIIELRDFTLR